MLRSKITNFHFETIPEYLANLQTFLLNSSEQFYTASVLQVKNVILLRYEALFLVCTLSFTPST